MYHLLDPDGWTMEKRPIASHPAHTATGPQFSRNRQTDETNKKNPIELLKWHFAIATLQFYSFVWPMPIVIVSVFEIIHPPRRPNVGAHQSSCTMLPATRHHLCMCALCKTAILKNKYIWLWNTQLVIGYGLFGALLWWSERWVVRCWPKCIGDGSYRVNINI